MNDTLPHQKKIFDVLFLCPMNFYLLLSKLLPLWIATYFNSNFVFSPNSNTRLEMISFRLLRIGFLIATVRNDWVLTKPRLCSKFSLFKMPWLMLEVLPQLISLDPSLPYLRAFQWGTVWPYTSSGFKNMTGQSWKL